MQPPSGADCATSGAVLLPASWEQLLTRLRSSNSDARARNSSCIRSRDTIRADAQPPVSTHGWEHDARNKASRNYEHIRTERGAHRAGRARCGQPAEKFVTVRHQPPAVRDAALHCNRAHPARVSY